MGSRVQSRPAQASWQPGIRLWYWGTPGHSETLGAKHHGDKAIGMYVYTASLPKTETYKIRIVNAVIICTVARTKNN